MQRISKDDRVRVIAGKDKGVEGRVVKMLPSRDRVLVEGVNFVTKHRPLQQTPRGMEGGIIETEAPIHVSNVMPVCPSCGEAVRVGFALEDASDPTTKRRVCRKCAATF
jgi:large subunit ribosomal protein L24